MVVTLDLHGDAHAAADIHYPGVLSRTMQYVFALGGKALEQEL